MEIRNNIALPDEIFRLIRDMVYDHCGLHFDDDSKFLMEGRLQQSILRKQFDNFKDYYYFLKYDKKRDEEFTSLIDLLTIHETYFFREENQLKTFSEEILPELREKKINAGSKDIRIWSAGCSTGEEPYTIAMLIHENDAFKDWNITILGTDVSQRVLNTARSGKYQNSSFRCIDSRYVNKYFIKEESGYRIVDDLKKNVNFFYLNLIDQNRLAFISSMDLIFCRNVIIYFDTEVKKKVIGIFHNKLNKGGYLFLGHSESLMNLSTSFALRHFKFDMVYQKQ